MTPQTYIFFGLSGSGKGKQAELLMAKLAAKDAEKKVLYIETGEKLREISNRDSYTGREIKKILNNGGLAPVFLPIYIWSEYLINNVAGGEHLILDGTPRKVEEAEILDAALTFYKREAPVVILLEISEDCARKRLAVRGRSDDNKDEVEKRLQWYKTDVIPAVEFFKNNSGYKFIPINGDQSIEAVHQEIIQKIGL
jgi:adenylate kinase